MPTALLLFDLETPDEKTELGFMLNARNHESALFEYSQWLRSQLKHCDLDEVTAQAYEKAQENFFRILEDHGVELM